jgi:peroxiredoxin Q/BCP
VLEVGDTAPDFELGSDTGDPVRLSHLRGKKVILYFYPKDDTPGCTTEACEFRDRLPNIERAGAVVLGVSPDTVKSHQKFKAKYELPFPLGRTYEGILRSTFLIDEAGKIEQIFQKVRPKGHGDKVLQALEE